MKHSLRDWLGMHTHGTCWYCDLLRTAAVVELGIIAIVLVIGLFI